MITRDTYIKYPTKTKKGAEEAIPNSLEDCLHLASQYLKGGDSGSAIKVLLAYLDKEPDCHPVYNNLGSIYFNLHDYDRARQAFTDALAHSNSEFQYYFNLARTLQNQKDYSAAITNLKKSIALNPNYAPLYNSLGQCYRALCQYDEAIGSFEKASITGNGKSSSILNLGITYIELGLYRSAIEKFKEYAADEGWSVEILLNIIYAVRRLNDVATEESLLRQGLQQHETNPDLLNALGVYFKDHGEDKNAEDCFARAMSNSGNDAERILNYSLVHKFTVGDVWCRSIEERLQDPSSTDYQRSLLFFALAKAYSDQERYFLAFNSWLQANGLRHKLSGYTSNQDQDVFAKLLSVSPQTLPHVYQENESEKPHIDEPIPIFIVGMPRSGTSIVESLLSNHSQITPQGELEFLRIAVEQSKIIEDPSNEAVFKLRGIYYDRLKQLDIPTPYFIDKMPANFRWIGYIRAAIPRARIICMSRNSRPLLFSLFRQIFSGTGNSYSYDLIALVRYYNTHNKLMEHWKTNYPDKLVTFSYEDLVSQPETSLRQLVADIGLVWEEACLATSTNRRSVKTASASQVSKPIFSKSNAEWQNYEPFLNSIFNKLGVD